MKAFLVISTLVLYTAIAIFTSSHAVTHLTTYDYVMKVTDDRPVGPSMLMGAAWLLYWSWYLQEKLK